jgi:hypothetical protein
VISIMSVKQIVNDGCSIYNPNNPVHFAPYLGSSRRSILRGSALARGGNVAHHVRASSAAKYALHTACSA